jgi:sec-independent protein translocase protein TatC
MNPKQPPNQNPHLMSLVEHLGDLRRCLLHSFIALTLGTAATLYFSKDLFDILIRPLASVLPEQSHFIATTPFESYFVYLKTAALAGFLLTAPYLFFEIWRFISPGLFKKEKRVILPAAFLTGFFFVGGALFGYFVVFPMGFKFVVAIFQGSPIVFLPKMSDYFSFATKFLLAFGVTFELPLIILVLARLGLIDYGHIKRFRKYAVILVFVVAALLTPGPDVISQLFMALPLLILYELGGLFAYFFGKQRASATLD